MPVSIIVSSVAKIHLNLPPQTLTILPENKRDHQVYNSRKKSWSLKSVTTVAANVKNTKGIEAKAKMHEGENQVWNQETRRTGNDNPQKIKKAYANPNQIYAVQREKPEPLPQEKLAYPL
jgi:hypothetical protein